MMEGRAKVNATKEGGLVIRRRKKQHFNMLSFPPSLLFIPILIPPPSVSLCVSLLIRLLQLIYDLGVSFRVIMWVWSGMACMVFLNCFLNWPAESFPAPEDTRYTSVHSTCCREPKQTQSLITGKSSNEFYHATP